MSEGESSGAERKSIFNAFSSLWTYRNGDFSPLAYPTIATEHVYADNPVVLRDDEPTSIIAHTLRFVRSLFFSSSPDWLLSLHSSKKYYQAFESTDLPRIREALSSNKAESIHNGAGEGTATPSPDPELAKTIEDLLRASSQRSFKLGGASSFSSLLPTKLTLPSHRADVELGDISARCTVFWVEQFEALRRQCGCDNQFVESLSRCFKWDAAGGKSKVDFMKTLGAFLSPSLRVDGFWQQRAIQTTASSSSNSRAPKWRSSLASRRPTSNTWPTLSSKAYVLSFFPLSVPSLIHLLRRNRPFSRRSSESTASVSASTTETSTFSSWRCVFPSLSPDSLLPLTLFSTTWQNLFYGRQLNQIFDLKGSTRNRRADESNPVLLDENLLERGFPSLPPTSLDLCWCDSTCSLAQEPLLRSWGVEAVYQAGDL
jgi:hypothetical protein